MSARNARPAMIVKTAGAVLRRVEERRRIHKSSCTIYTHTNSHDTCFVSHVVHTGTHTHMRQIKFHVKSTQTNNVIDMANVFVLRTDDAHTKATRFDHLNTHRLLQHLQTWRRSLVHLLHVLLHVGEDISKSARKTHDRPLHRPDAQKPGALRFV